ncbi:MAG TPA: sulfotransferase family protein [Rhodobacteraceae bacterium]|nr:sulfotransferase family protein [Paracoccaceae bacterium]
MPEKTFILGVGAQKSGTTWLHRYIHSNPNADMGPLKEYHVWDAKYHNPTLANITALGKAGQAVRRWLGQPDKATLRAQFRADPEQYFDYFAARLDQQNITVTGDITPSYSALPPEVLRQIKVEFATRNIDVRVVFLMRDPVERVWSALRMKQRKGFGDAKLEHDAALRGYFQSSQAKMRGNYHETIQNLEEVFAPEDIYIGMFESMFEAAELARLSAFLDLPVGRFSTKRKVNSGGERRALSPALAQEIRVAYADVYEFCALRYPETKELWRVSKPESGL